MIPTIKTLWSKLSLKLEFSGSFIPFVFHVLYTDKTPIWLSEFLHFCQSWLSVDTLLMISKPYRYKTQDGGVEGCELISPARTPKLQLTAEQPLTEERWIPPEKDSPCQRVKEKAQQDGRRGKLHWDSNPLYARHAKRAQATLVHNRSQLPQRLSQICLWVFECLLQRHRSAVAYRMGRGSACSRPGSPSTWHKPPWRRSH